ncbi:MAG: type I restriction enzyme HsdR N-terminal domain-containing protein [Chlorobi bacterium]|nr:type I restriction enzyme HsdR N-terminal domain-containing protein [Chlorobiota bacterium]
MRNFGRHSLKLKEEEGKKFIWDPIRKGWFPAFPEEFVRQQVIATLLEDLKVPSIYIAPEWKITKELRADVVVFGIDLKPKLVVECKAPNKPINPATWIQIFEYVEKLKPRFLWLTNGRNNWIARFDEETKNWQQIATLPHWDELKQ